MRSLPEDSPVTRDGDPANIELKRERLRKIYSSPPGSVRLVPLDFETQDLGEVLTQHGYSPQGRTFFVWEAVTQYLTEDAVRDTFRFLATAQSGSELVFTYVRKDFLDGTALYGGDIAYREFVTKQRLWRFGLLPDQVAGFLEPFGWTETEQMGQVEFTDRYVAPSHRHLPVSEIERSVHALKA